MASKNKPKKESPISPKQERFCQEYVIDMNGTQAAIRAGYSARSANAMASALLAKHNISLRVKELQQKIGDKAEVSAAQILAEIDNLAMMDAGQIFDFAGKVLRIRNANEIPPHARKWIQSVKVKPVLRKLGRKTVKVNEIEVRLWSKPDMLRLATQRRGLLKDKVELTGADDGPIQVVEVVKPVEKKE